MLIFIEKSSTDLQPFTFSTSVFIVGKLFTMLIYVSSNSISSVTSPESMPSMSSRSSEIESIEENGRLTTPTLKESEQSHGSKRHHLDRTTPAKGTLSIIMP